MEVALVSSARPTYSKRQAIKKYKGNFFKSPLVKLNV